MDLTSWYSSCTAATEAVEQRGHRLGTSRKWLITVGNPPKPWLDPKTALTLLIKYPIRPGNPWAPEKAALTASLVPLYCKISRGLGILVLSERCPLSHTRFARRASNSLQKGQECQVQRMAAVGGPTPQSSCGFPRADYASCQPAQRNNILWMEEKNWKPPKSCKYQQTLLFQPWFQSGTTRFRHHPQLSRPSVLFPVRSMSSWLGPGSWVLMPWSQQRAWRTQGMKAAMRRLRSSQKSQRPRGKFSSRA